MKNHFDKRKQALAIAVIYVGCATLSVCSVYPADPFYGEWSLYGLIFTFPVSLLSFGYRYADANSLSPVFFIQFIMFILTFFILSRFLKDKKKNV